MDVAAVGPLTVLLVDSYPGSGPALAQLLKLQGFNVAAAESYVEALERARFRRPDVLVSSIRLSDGDGCELLAELRSLYRVSAIALTGLDVVDHARLKRAGITRILVKPINVEALTAAITEAARLFGSEGAPTRGDWPIPW